VLVVERRELVIAGHKRDALRFIVKDERGMPRGTATMAVVPSAYQGVTRMVSCHASEASACDGVLDAIAEHVRTDTSLPPPTVKKSAPVFAGRALRLPNGCEHIDLGRKTCVRCGAPSVCFSAAAPDTPAGIEWLFDAEKGILRLHGAVQEATRPCRIGGGKAVCRTAAVTRADGSEVGTVVSSAELRGTRYIVHCNLWTAPRSPLPPPCGNIIQLK
jgi:hypothetical protein